MVAVDVRWATLAVPGACTGWLTEAERERAARLRHADDRARFVGAHALVRVLVAELVGCAPVDVELSQRCHRCGGPHGAPVAVVGDARAPEVSLAHAGALVVAAASSSSAAVGVDVEPHGQPATAYAAIAETLPGASATDDTAGLLRRWVAAEAIAKARGVGLVDSLEAGDEGGYAVLGLALDAAHAGAVAVAGGGPVVLREAAFDWAGLS